MSVKQSELEERTRLSPWPIKEPEQYAYVYSAATGDRYDGIVEMVKELGGRWTSDGKYIIDEFGDIRSEREYRRDMEVVSHG